MTRTSRMTAMLALAFAVAGAAQAQRAADAPLLGGQGSVTIGPISIDGNDATTTISAGTLRLDLGIHFEQVVGLTPASLGLSARLLSPSELQNFLGSPSLSVALPIVVRIEPPPSGGLSFSGVAGIDVHTHNLEFTANCPLRLYKAPLGGTFVDVTESMGMGSYRARGSTGGFSEFVIVVDLRNHPSVVTDKINRLDALLAAHSAAMPPALADALADQVDAIRAEWVAGDAIGAIDQVDAFSAAVQAVAGNPLPNVWRSARDIANVAGDLRAAAATLRFSLNLAS